MNTIRKAKERFITVGNSGLLSCKWLLAALPITFLVAVKVKQTECASVFYTVFLLIFVSINCFAALPKQHTRRNKELNVNDLTGLWLALYFFTDSILLNVFAMGSYLFYSKLISMIATAKRNLHPDAFFRSLAAGVAANVTTYFLILMLNIFTVK